MGEGRWTVDGGTGDKDRAMYTHGTHGTHGTLRRAPPHLLNDCCLYLSNVRLLYSSLCTPLPHLRRDSRSTHGLQPHAQRIRALFPNAAMQIRMRKMQRRVQD